jgi:SpoVK/Ycf46/Vps4 family AAA+-type ATPase
VEKVTMAHFTEALEKITPSIDKEIIRSYTLPTVKKTPSIYG